MRIILLVIFLILTPFQAYPNDAFETTQQAKLTKLPKNIELNEVKYGNKVYLKISATGVISKDELLNKYVNAVRDRLLPFVERESFPFMISILDDSRIYATSTPGGFIYITVGMMQYLKTESELAAVIAHEMGQTQYKPQEFRFTKRLFGFSRSVVGVASFVVPFGFGVPQGLKVVDKTLLKDASVAKMCALADEKAMQYLDGSGYDPFSLRDVLSAFLTYDAEAFELLNIYLVLRPVTKARVEKVNEWLNGRERNEQQFEHEIKSYERVKKYLKGYIGGMPR